MGKKVIALQTVAVTSNMTKFFIKKPFRNPANSDSDIITQLHGLLYRYHDLGSYNRTSLKLLTISVSSGVP